VAGSATHQHVGRSQGLDEPPLELVVSKLRCPAVRPGAVRRSLVIERLARGDSRPIVSLVAPAGYGKTTLLSQWAERHGQPLAWVSLDERDNNPKVLLTYIAEALNAVEPVEASASSTRWPPPATRYRTGSSPRWGRPSPR